MLNVEYAVVSAPVDFGAAVRAARKHQGMSQMQLAAASGCSQRFVSQLERGKETAELGKALQVASAAGLFLRVGGTETVKERRAALDETIARIATQSKARKRTYPKLADILAQKG